MKSILGHFTRGERRSGLGLVAENWGVFDGWGGWVLVMMNGLLDRDDIFRIHAQTLRKQRCASSGGAQMVQTDGQPNAHRAVGLDRHTNRRLAQQDKIVPAPFDALSSMFEKRPATVSKAVIFADDLSRLHVDL